MFFLCTNAIGSGAVVVVIIVGFITTFAISAYHFRFQVYSIQHYVRKFGSDLRQVGGFLRVLRFTPPIKLIAEILLKVELDTINQT